MSAVLIHTPRRWRERVRDRFPHTATKLRKVLGERGFRLWVEHVPPRHKAGRVRRWSQMSGQIWGIFGTNAETLRVCLLEVGEGAARASGSYDDMRALLAYAVRTWTRRARGREIEEAAAEWVPGKTK